MQMRWWLSGPLHRIGLESGHIILARALGILRDGLFKIGRLSKPAEIFSDALDHRFQIRLFVLAQQVSEIVQIVILAALDLLCELIVVEIVLVALPQLDDGERSCEFAVNFMFTACERS